MPDRRRNRPRADLPTRLTEIETLTDRFCAAHLDNEYRDLCRGMAVAASQAGVPLTRGKAAGWAAGIVYAVGWVNFVDDPGRRHHMKADDMAKQIGVSPATLLHRARVIMEALALHRMAPRWCTQQMAERNLLAWLGPVGDL